MKEFVIPKDEHWYPSQKKEDTFYPSVTTVLGKLKSGLEFVDDETLRFARERGTKVHYGCELLEGNTLSTTLERVFYTLQEWEMLMGFVQWHKDVKPAKSLLVEHTMVSDKLQLAGTLDRLYEIDGKITLLDIKTGSTIMDSAWLQVAAYAKLYGKKVDQTAILRLTDKKKSRYEYVVEPDWKKHYKVFESVHTAFKYLYPKQLVKVIDVPETLSLN